MSTIMANSFLGIILSILCFYIGSFIYSRFSYALLNPFLIAAVLMSAIVSITPFSLEHYQASGSIISFFIVPATTVLALRIYRQRTLLKANILPIILGCTIGSVTSLSSTWFLCRLFEINDTLLFSLLPKSVTTAIALQLAEQTGGIGAITVVGILLNGVGTAIIVPPVCKLFKMKDPVAIGIGMGTAGHAIGTAKAIELGEIEGGMSGLALCLTGIITSVLYLFIF